MADLQESFWDNFLGYIQGRTVIPVIGWRLADAHGSTVVAGVEPIAYLPTTVNDLACPRAASEL
jgi:hypothetical protein